MSSPIADLSYRNYDGGLSSPRMRWWVIAKMGMKQALKKKVLWLFSAFSASYYLMIIIQFFFLDQIVSSGGQQAGNFVEQFYRRIQWKDQFVHGFSTAQIWFLAIALILGAGSIANDNRANALLVYLSKPCTKWDYLFGKWVGVFLPLLIVSVVPALVFFLYGLLSFLDKGFISQDPWLPVKLLLLFPLGAAFHASLVVGFSSLFNQGRVAGAAYAGLYFLTNFFTQLMVGTWINLAGGRFGDEPPTGPGARLVSYLYYASVDGLNIAMAKGILGTDGTPIFNVQQRTPQIPAAPLWPVLLIVIGLGGLSLFIAWRRVRAVEVVG